MTPRRLRQYGKSVLREIDLPRPFSVTALCHSIAERRGRPLYLHPLPAETGADMPCGLWFMTAAADHIFYEKQTSDFHRDQIILHELGHMLCGHTVPPISTDSGISADSGTVDREIVRAALRRTSYTTELERHAEIVASLILKRSNRALSKPSGTHDRWLGSALGLIDD